MPPPRGQFRVTTPIWSYYLLRKMGKSGFREPRTACVDIAIWWHNLLPCACSQMSFSISPQSMMVGMQKPFTVRSLKNSEMPAQGPRLPQFTKTKCRLWVLVGLELIVSFLIWLSVEKKKICVWLLFSNIKYQENIESYNNSVWQSREKTTLDIVQ